MFVVGAYYHEKFVKGNRKLSLQITRIKAPQKRRRVNAKLLDGVKAPGASLSARPRLIPLESAIKPLSSSDTTEWLISAGVPFAALDPYPFAQLDCEKKNMSIWSCADEITSIFNT